MPRNLYQKLPQTPGVYIMKNAKGKILYIGKAANLKRRVSSYFQKVHDYRIEKLVKQVRKIDYKKTDTSLEALILESEFIKKHQPPFNVLEKDDKSFLYAEITREKFPRVLSVRGKDKNVHGEYYGPFTSGSALREGLKIIRRIFPYSTHRSDQKLSKPCFDYQIGLCPGICVGRVSEREYQRTIENIRFFFTGKKRQILKSLEKEMRQESKNLEFEKAEKIRRQIFALKHIQDIAFISENDVIDHKSLVANHRIEGYDISNISGTFAVGSMVVFKNNKPDRTQYRKFKIYTVKGPDDTGMIKEVFARRVKHQEWPLPDLILIDGGSGQVNAVKSVLHGAGLKIPIVGIAKGPKRKKNDLIYAKLSGSGRKITVDKKTLIQIRDEAHRFAVEYHKKIRRKRMGV